MRYVDWPSRLNKYIIDAQKLPFVWGESDCCTFAAGAVIAILEDGTDYMEEFRGKYTTEKEAFKALKEFGGGTLAEVLTNKFGEPITAAHAQRGDVVIYDNCVGVAMGRYCMFAHEEDGYRMVPSIHVDIAIRVQ